MGNHGGSVKAHVLKPAGRDHLTPASCGLVHSLTHLESSSRPCTARLERALAAAKSVVIGRFGWIGHAPAASFERMVAAKTVARQDRV